MADESPGAMTVKSAIDNSIEQVTRGHTKEKIPAKSIIEMLNTQPLREELMPLLKDVLDKISQIEGLDEAISNLLKNKQNEELTEALKKLQNKLQSIYENKQSKEDSFKGGRKRRRTNKRKNYKKRRSTKYR